MTVGLDDTSGCMDNLQNYDIDREIRRGSRSVLYLATCKKGRMRSRQVALKKIPRLSDGRAEDSASELHRSLFHPSLVSLFSSFSTSSFHYQVLELCPHGSLQEFLHSRSSPVLSEAELRGLLKALVTSLIYLRKSLVIHRNIRPSNILFADDYRVKLADFSSAIRVDSPTSLATIFGRPSDCASPELVNNSPYSFETDLWSLGALMVTCLSGRPAFEAATLEDTFTNITQGHYVLPDTASFEAKDLAIGLLQQDPAHRIPLHRILSHPFFNPSLPVMTLSGPRTSLTASMTNTPVHLHRPSKDSAATNSRFLKLDNRSPTNLDSLKPRFARRFASDPTSSSRTVSVLGRVRSASGRTSSHAGGSQHESACMHLGRFVNGLASGSETLRAPSASATPALTDDSAHSDSDRDLECDVASVTGYPTQGRPRHRTSLTDLKRLKALQDGTELDAHPLLLPPRLSARSRRDIASTLCSRPAESEERQDPSTEHSYGILPDHLARLVDKKEERRIIVAAPARKCATGTCCDLAPLTTLYLSPRTHKVPHGNITVLPSKSMLVDFREGERRKGRKGTEVLVIAPDGLEIKVYAAPHLSTPCCLAEPTAEYSLPALPHSYQRQYADAFKLVNKLKKRIPRLVLHEPDGRCTLMANDPFGDVEILAPYPDTNASPHGNIGTATRQLRLLRRHRTLEISRHLPTGPRGATGEWTKRVIPALGDGCHIRVPDEEARLLDETDNGLLEIFYRFLRVCEAAENAGNTMSDRQPPDSMSGAPTPVRLRPASVPKCVEDENGPCQTSLRIWPAQRTRNPLADTSNTTEAPTGSSLIATCATASSNTFTTQLASLRLEPRPPKIRSASATCAARR